MPKGGHSKFFPGKLRAMLDQADGLGLGHASSWVSEGRAFAIHDPDVFMEEIAPQFFDKQTHLRSFHRQLSIWGFTRLETGAGGRGVWFHKYFLQDNPELIKHIKRVPVKNPKPSMAMPKHQLPDYTNYQLPVSFEPGSQQNTNNPNQKKMVPMPVHQPHHGVPAAAAAGLPKTNLLMPATGSGMHMPPPGASIGYLSTLGRPAPPRYPPHNPVHQAPAGMGVSPSTLSDQARGRYPPFILTNYQHGYQPSAVASMGHLPMALSGGNPNPNVPTGNPSNLGLGDVAQQLLACRNTNPNSQGSSLGEGNGNNDVNKALLAMLVDSRRHGNPAPNSDTAGLSQELVSAIARQNVYPQGPKTS